MSRVSGGARTTKQGLHVIGYSPIPEWVLHRALASIRDGTPRPSFSSTTKLYQPRSRHGQAQFHEPLLAPDTHTTSKIILCKACALPRNDRHDALRARIPDRPHCPGIRCPQHEGSQYPSSPRSICISINNLPGPLQPPESDRFPLRCLRRHPRP